MLLPWSPEEEEAVVVDVAEVSKNSPVSEISSLAAAYSQALADESTAERACVTAAVGLPTSSDMATVVWATALCVPVDTNTVPSPLAELVGSRTKTLSDGVVSSRGLTVGLTVPLMPVWDTSRGLRVWSFETLSVALLETVGGDDEEADNVSVCGPLERVREDVVSIVGELEELTDTVVELEVDNVGERHTGSSRRRHVPVRSTHHLHIEE